MGYINSEFQGHQVVVWERTQGYRLVKTYEPTFEMYLEHPSGTYKSIFGKPLVKRTYNNNREFKAAREENNRLRIQMYESDISPAIKVISEHYYGKDDGEPINTTYLDIEVDQAPHLRGYSKTTDPFDPISAISLYHQWEDRALVLAVPPPEWNGKIDPEVEKLCKFVICKDEEELLLHFLNEIEDSDALCGWNSEAFDFPYIAHRLQMTLGDAALAMLSFPESRPPQFYDKPNKFGGATHCVRAGGRILADYMLLYQKFEQNERESYRLDYIASLHLEDLRKVEYKGTLFDLYHYNFDKFLEYSYVDTIILKEFERTLGFMALATSMYRQSGGVFSNVLGTVRLADYAVYNHCRHELDVKVPDIKNNLEERGELKGARVLDTIVGDHRWCGTVDVSSLYPSVIRTVNISPDTVVGQFVKEEEAAIKVADGSDEDLVFIDEETGESIIEKGWMWKALFEEQGYSMSGHGTVFRNDKPGIIPSVLSGWYAKRQAANKKIKEIDEQIAQLLADYEPIKE